ncbi:MAG: hypothetical protein JWN66_4934 [Sphingomonas bacterium]|nr:hypothetical protein [Sphingomonas bacterium]
MIPSPTFPAPVVERKTVAQGMADVLGPEDAAHYRRHPGNPSFAGIAAADHDLRMASLITDLNAAYAARGHAK